MRRFTDALTVSSPHLHLDIPLSFWVGMIFGMVLMGIIVHRSKYL